MSERIDIMMPPVDCLPYFVVDTTGPLFKPVAYPAPVPVDYLTAGDYTCVFTKGDNFVLMSGGLVMPLSFQIDRGQGVAQWPYIRFYMYAYGQTTGNIYKLKEVSGAGATPSFYMPMENYDSPVDIFIDIQNQDPVGGQYLKNEDFTIGVSQALYFTNVSMAGIPASLNATTQFILPYVKILHNFPLTNIVP